MAWELALRNLSLRLRWIPRDQNTLADELSDGVHKHFSKANEVRVDPNMLRFHVLQDMLSYGRDLYADIESKKKRKVRLGSPANAVQRKKWKRPKHDRLRAKDPW